MARTVAELPRGTRITDYISVGLILKTFPEENINEVLEKTGKLNQRQRDLPAHIVVYYVIAMSLFMQVSYLDILRCLLEGIEWLRGPTNRVNMAGKSGISQARTRLGYIPVRHLHDEMVRLISTVDTKGSWYRRWHMVSLDISALETADSRENEMAFGGFEGVRDRSDYPLLRFASLVEHGTLVLFGTQLADRRMTEMSMAQDVVRNLRSGMLCLADLEYLDLVLLQIAVDTGADVLWKIERPPVVSNGQVLPDGSYLSRIYTSVEDRIHDINGIEVRIIEYTSQGDTGSLGTQRLLTTVFDSSEASAQELVSLYNERCQIDTALSELKPHLRGDKIQLRSKTPELAKQEFYGLMMAHFAVRKMMYDISTQGSEKADLEHF